MAPLGFLLSCFESCSVAGSLAELFANQTGSILDPLVQITISTGLNDPCFLYLDLHPSDFSLSARKKTPPKQISAPTDATHKLFSGTSCIFPLHGTWSFPPPQPNKKDTQQHQRKEDQNGIVFLILAVACDILDKSILHPFLCPSLASSEVVVSKQ